MRFINTLTKLLFPFFIGVLVVGLFSGTTDVWIWGCGGLILNIIVGTITQYIIENVSPTSEQRWERLTFEEKRAVAQSIIEEIKEQMRKEGIDVERETKEFCDEFNKENGSGRNSEPSQRAKKENSWGVLCEQLTKIYLELKEHGGARLANITDNDEAIKFLFTVCGKFDYPPIPPTLYRVFCVSVENLNGEEALVYSFEYNPRSMCQNVYVFLVRTKAGRIRLFTVETSNPFALCEYSGYSHVNYGQIELKDVPTRIKEILSEG